MAIKDTATGTFHHECPTCDAFVDLSVARVQDVESGAIFCDALCHHEMQFGITPSPVTMAEAASLDRARAWMARNR